MLSTTTSRDPHLDKRNRVWDPVVYMTAREKTPWDKASKKESGKMFDVIQGKKDSSLIHLPDGNILFERGNHEQGYIKIERKHLDRALIKEGAITVQELLSAPKILRNLLGVEDRPRMKTYVIINEEGVSIFYIIGKNMIDAKKRLINIYSNRNKKLP